MVYHLMSAFLHAWYDTGFITTAAGKLSWAGMPEPLTSVIRHDDPNAHVFTVLIAQTRYHLGEQFLCLYARLVAGLQTHFKTELACAATASCLASTVTGAPGANGTGITALAHLLPRTTGNSGDSHLPQATIRLPNSRIWAALGNCGGMQLSWWLPLV